MDALPRKIEIADEFVALSKALAHPVELSRAMV
jgi:hypothetical protein